MRVRTLRGSWRVVMEARAGRAGRPSIAPYRNGTRAWGTARDRTTGHEGGARARGTMTWRGGEGRATGRGPVEAKRWGSEKGVGKYDG